MASRAGFDPLNELPLAQAAKPAELGPLNLRTLTPFQRALLVIDGTVTSFIEAYTMEPVEVVRLSQSDVPLDQDHRWLEAGKGTRVAARQVMLQGQYSQTFYGYAVSLVVLERLPQRIRERLGVDGESLGRILNDQEMETRREVLWFGRERATQLPAAVRRASDGEFISRTYRIIVGQRPIMLITERFPIGLDRHPSHH